MKRINKILIMGIMVAFLPSVASAATLSYDETKKSSENGIFKIPIMLEVAENENVANIDLSCSTGYFDVSCSFEEIVSDVIIKDKKTFVYIGSNDGNNNFPAGKNTALGYVVVTNTQSVSKEIDLKLTSSKVTTPNSMKFTLKGKEEEKPLSHDATLKTLKTSQGTMTPEFNPNTYEYTVYGIADTINSVNLSWSCNDGDTCKPSITGNSNSKKVNLQQGDNKIEVVVNSQAGDDADRKTYILNVIRGDNGYNSAKLASLSFGEYTLTPAFKSDVLEYSLTVPNNITSLVNIMKYEKQDTKATESLSGFDSFIVGENKATITIDNVNGDGTTTYIINITRMNDTDIEVLKYKNGEITFRDSEGIQNVLSENDFKTQYEDEWKKIEDNTYKFDVDGNIIKSNDDVDSKESPKKKSKAWIIVVVIIVGLLVIAVSGFFIFKKKKPSSTDKDNDNNNTPEDENSKESEENNQDEIDETNIEEDAIKDEDKKVENDTMEIDEALVDLMSTKKYNFKDDE